MEPVRWAAVLAADVTGQGVPPTAGTVVVLCLDTLGDLVLRQPFLSGLVDSGRPTTVVVRRSTAELVGHLDPRLTTMATEIDPYGAPSEGSWQALEALRDEIAVTSPAAIVAALGERTYVDEWLLHAFPAVERIGFANPRLAARLRATLLSRGPGHPVPKGEPLSIALTASDEEHEATRQARLYAAVTGVELRETRPRLVVSEADKARAREMLDRHGLEAGRYVVGCPAGTANIPLKAWPAEEYAELAFHVWKVHGFPTLLVGSKAEEPALSAVAASAEERGLRLPVWTGGAGELGTLIGLMDASRAYVGNDTGPMHFAAAVGKPVAARFGGGHWLRFLPLAPRSFVATRGIPCAGCGWSCWMAEPACMTWIDPSILREGVDWLLSGDAPEERVSTGEPLDPKLEAAIRHGASLRRSADADIDRLRGDQTERLEQIHHLTRAIDELDRLRCADIAVLRRAHDERVAVLDAALAESETDRAARLDAIHHLARINEEQERKLNRFSARMLRKLRLI